MPKITEGPVGQPIDGHPELTELFGIIMNAQPLLVVQSGDGASPAFVVVADPFKDAKFTFTKTDTGYTVERS